MKKNLEIQKDAFRQLPKKKYIFHMYVDLHVDNPFCYNLEHEHFSQVHISKDNMEERF